MSRGRPSRLRRLYTVRSVRPEARAACATLALRPELGARSGARSARRRSVRAGYRCSRPGRASPPPGPRRGPTSSAANARPAPGAARTPACRPGLRDLQRHRDAGRVGDGAKDGRQRVGLTDDITAPARARPGTCPAARARWRGPGELVGGDRRPTDQHAGEYQHARVLPAPERGHVRPVPEPVTRSEGVEIGRGGVLRLRQEHHARIQVDLDGPHNLAQRRRDQLAVARALALVELHRLARPGMAGPAARAGPDGCGASCRRGWQGRCGPGSCRQPSAPPPEACGRRPLAGGCCRSRHVRRTRGFGDSRGSTDGPVTTWTAALSAARSAARPCFPF